jgi:catalase
MEPVDREETVGRWRMDWAGDLPARTPEDQARLLRDVHRAIVELQEAARGSQPPERALHAHGIFATEGATLRVRGEIPPTLRLGPFVPGATWPALVRLSSAYPRAQSEEAADQRGLAVRITEGDRRLDLLGTTGEAHHASDAEAMVVSLRAAAVAARGRTGAQIRALAEILHHLGIADGLRMVRTIGKARDAGSSLAGLTFFSRAPFQLGNHAVRYRLAPPPGADPACHGSGRDALLRDLLLRLREGPIRWTLELQGYLDPRRTPMKDHRIPWDSPWLPVADLELARAELTPASARAQTVRLSERVAFRPDPEWDDALGPVLHPLGDLNIIRDVAYGAGSEGRSTSGGCPVMRS